MTGETSPETTPSARRERAIVAFSAMLGGIATFLVYRPDRDLPFDFLDFSEFLPLLERGSSFFDRLRDLMAYYAGQGRFNLIAYAGIVAKWEIWGANPIAWQWVRFATMWIAIYLAYRLVRRLGIGRYAALAGCAAIPFAPSAVDACMRLTTTEPLAVVLLLLACLLALQPYGRFSERSVGFGFAAIAVGIVILKEMLLVTLLLPLLLVYADGGLSPQLFSRRQRTLLLALVASLPLALIPILVTALSAPSDAYIVTFGSRWRPMSITVGMFFLSLLPFDPATVFPTSLTGFILVAVIGLLVVGWRLRLRMPNGFHDLSPRRLLMAAMVFPLTGTLVYMPWRPLNRFYAFPLIVGLVVISAVAFEAIAAWSRRALIAAWMIWAVVLASAAASAHSQTNRMAARQLTNRAVVSRLAELHQRFDTVLAATKQRERPSWQELGPTLERYGRVLGLDMPVVVNTLCEESRRRSLSTPGAAVITYSGHCEGFSAKDPVVFRYRRLRFPALSLTTDSLRVDFILPRKNAAADTLRSR